MPYGLLLFRNCFSASTLKLAQSSMAVIALVSTSAGAARGLPQLVRLPLRGRTVIDALAADAGIGDDLALLLLDHVPSSWADAPPPGPM